MPTGATSVVLLQQPGSPLAERIARELPAESHCIDASSRRLTIDGREPRWDGISLAAATLVFVERPEPHWPQPTLPEAQRDGEPLAEAGRRALAEREVRALRASALRLAARSTRCVNDPERAADCAAAAPLALQRLAAAGLLLAPWRLGRASDARGATALSPVLVDGPSAPAGELALLVETAAPTSAVLVVGGRCVVAERRASLLAASGEPASRPDASPLCAAALAALGLDFGVVHLAGDAIALVESAPLLSDWDARHGELVAHALAELLHTLSRT